MAQPAMLPPGISQGRTDSPVPVPSQHHKGHISVRGKLKEACPQPREGLEGSECSAPALLREPRLVDVPSTAEDLGQ